MSEVILRQEVQWFAEQMELKLRENEPEGGLLVENPFFLIERLKDELPELEGALIYGPNYDRQRVISEATDIANLVMMIAANAENDSFTFD